MQDRGQWEDDRHVQGWDEAISALDEPAAGVLPKL